MLSKDVNMKIDVKIVEKLITKTSHRNCQIEKVNEEGILLIELILLSQRLLAETIIIDYLSIYEMI